MYTTEETDRPAGYGVLNNTYKYYMDFEGAALYLKALYYVDSYEGTCTTLMCVFFPLQETIVTIVNVLS